MRALFPVLLILISLFCFLTADGTVLIYYVDEIKNSPSMNHEDDSMYNAVLQKDIKQIKGIIKKIDTRRKTLSVQVLEVKENQNVVRVGDATKNYSFDNVTVFSYDEDKKTVFTYGDEASHDSSLKEGDEIVITLVEGKPLKINATKHVKAVIEHVDIKHETLKVKVGKQYKKIPFRYLQVFTDDGRPASFRDIQSGDSVTLKINMGYLGSHK